MHIRHAQSRSYPALTGRVATHRDNRRRWGYDLSPSRITAAWWGNSYSRSERGFWVTVCDDRADLHAQRLTRRLLRIVTTNRRVGVTPRSTSHHSRGVGASQFRDLKLPGGGHGG